MPRPHRSGWTFVRADPLEKVFADRRPPLDPDHDRRVRVRVSAEIARRAGAGVPTCGSARLRGDPWASLGPHWGRGLP